MQTLPLLKFSITGGSSPRTALSIHISQQGETMVLIENAWPVLENTSEVGVYKFQLSRIELVKLIKIIQNIDAGETRYGKKLPGGLRYYLTIVHNKKEQKIQWGHFAEIPSSLRMASNLIQQQLQYSLLHPYQTLKASLDVSEQEGTITLHNTGTLPITLVVPEQQPMFLIGQLEKSETTHIPLPQVYSQAIPFEYAHSENTITIQPNAIARFNSKVQLEENKEHYALIAAQWEKIPSVDKTIYSFLCAKATQK